MMILKISNKFLKYFFILSFVLITSCKSERALINYDVVDLKKDVKIDLKVKEFNINSVTFFTYEEEVLFEKDIKTIFNYNSANKIVVDVSFNLLHKTSEGMSLKYITFPFGFTGSYLGYKYLSENTPNLFWINGGYWATFIGSMTGYYIGSFLSSFIDDDLTTLYGYVKVDIYDLTKTYLIYSFSKKISLGKNHDNWEDKGKILSNIIQVVNLLIKQNILNDKEKILKKYHEVAQKEPKLTPILIKVVSNANEFDENLKTIVKYNAEEILTEHKYPIVENNKKNCDKRDCLIEISKEAFAKKALFIDVIKNESNFLFTVSYIDVESNELLKTKSSVYNQNIDDIQSLSDFVKEIINSFSLK